MRHSARISRAFGATTVALLLGALALVGGAAADNEVGTLPGGTSIEVAIVNPAHNSVVNGPAVPVDGTAAVGQAQPVPNTALIYVIDVSGSTDVPAGAAVTRTATAMPTSSSIARSPPPGRSTRSRSRTARCSTWASSSSPARPPRATSIHWWGRPAHRPRDGRQLGRRAGRRAGAHVGVLDLRRRRRPEPVYVPQRRQPDELRRGDERGEHARGPQRSDDEDRRLPVRRHGDGRRRRRRPDHRRSGSRDQSTRPSRSARRRR